MLAAVVLGWAGFMKSLHHCSQRRSGHHHPPPPATHMRPRCRAPQLWHRSNWHWYLKLELGYDARPGAAASAADILLVWDDRLPGRLHCLVHSVLYQRLDLAWGQQVGGGRQGAEAPGVGSV